MAPARAGAADLHPRIGGLDIARALAIVGMVLVNFELAMGAERSGPPWLRTLAALFHGRSAALFVILAGIGASLGARRARGSPDPVLRRQARATLARRALFLFVIGWAFFALWPADILHYYGVYLAIGSLVVFTPSRRLLALAAGALAVSLVFIVGFDPLARWNLADYSYRGLLTPVGFVRNLLLDGFHPVFPWVAFYLFGLWLGRTDLQDPRWRRTLTLAAATAVAVAETLAWIVVGPKGATRADLSSDSWRWLFSVEPLPPLPMYVLAGAATATLVLCGAIWLGAHLPRCVRTPLESTGQLALTIYLAHVLVGMATLDALGRLEDQSLTWAVLTSLAFSVLAIAGAWAWRRRFARGPVEALLRRVAG